MFRDAVQTGVIAFGLFTFGAIDNDNCKPDLSYVPLTYLNKYATNTFKVDQFKIGKYSRRSTQTAQLDTGVATIMAPVTEFNVCFFNLEEKMSQVFDISLKSQLTYRQLSVN